MGRERSKRRLPGSRSRSQSHSRSRSSSRYSVSRYSGSSAGASLRQRSATTSSFLDFIAGKRTPPASGGPHAKPQHRIYSLYRLMMLELNLPTTDHRPREMPRSVSNDDTLEQVVNMVRVPLVLERFMVFGLMVCLNSFLTIFTLVPLKICIVAWRTVDNLISRGQNLDVAPELRGRKGHAAQSYGEIVVENLRYIKKDLYTTCTIGASLFILALPYFDISRLYHDVRGQAHIKLYVMFGVLEVADKLLSSIGHDLLTILHGLTFSSRLTSGAPIALFFTLSVIYLSLHSYVLIYQAVSLNVAANSYSNALLTLLLSNQFAELKSSVFKKFDREGLFQVTMADLTERFQLSLMLGIIAIRNLLQLNGKSIGLIPNSWKSWNTWIGAIFGPSTVVIGSEILVDWLKHCYISKFNKVRPRVYNNFLYVLSLDFVEVFKSGPNVSAAPSHELTDYVVLTKRIGLPLLACIVCFLRMTLPDLKRFFLFSDSLTYSIISSVGLLVVAFLTLLFARLVLGLLILKWANRIKTQHQQAQQLLKPPVSAGRIMGSSNISLNVEESAIESDSEIGSEIEEYLPSPSSPFNTSFTPGVPNTEASSINPISRSYLYDAGEKIPPTVEEMRNNNDRGEEGLENVMRYEMSSKRIW
ncbi:Endoplasmic reticulum membrane protein 65 [Meyerozyma sp. JA9]|nr:Endoplasmic reticulum membrane protein 65 [Meyerozyma sp. JA9]